jgi:acyl-CoA thioester hydrolase
MLNAWEFASPHVVSTCVQADDIDAYGHVNNAVYLRWIDLAAWSHSAALGIPIDTCTRLRRGMAVLRMEIDYVRAALAGDCVEVGTWIAASDRKLRVTRQFQLRHATDGATLARAVAQYVCFNLDNGRATRMPPEFTAAYGVT